MSWARIDDAFDDHPKVLALLEYEQGAAAIGLWTLCLTWAHRNTRRKGKVPGLLPVSLPRRYLGPGARELASLLVKERLWEDRGEEGWIIHDFERYLPTEQTRDARSEAGKRGAQARWGNRAGRDSKLPSVDSKPMASDGGNGESGIEQDTASPGSLQHPPRDGKEPSDDGNLLSGLLTEDGKPMASDGSRAPAHRAIPNGIAPIPAPGFPVPVSVGDPTSAEGGSGGDDASQAPPKPKQKRGTRIPDDFKVRPEMVDWARRRCPNVDGRTETEKFVNHWSNKPGREALKLDWTKAWQNWMLTAEQQAPRGRAATGRQSQTPVAPGDEWKFNRS